MLFMEPVAADQLYSSFQLPLFPFEQIVLFLAIILPVSVYVGYRLGRATYLRDGVPTDAPAHDYGGTSLGAMLALLGLLLAFSFGSALNWADARNKALVDDAATIGTAFLRADILSEPGRSELRNALLDYARTRYMPKGSIQTKEDLQAFFSETLAKQSRLWPVAIDAVGGDTPPPIQTFILGSVNNVLDAHTSRFRTGSEALPTVIKLMLLSAAILALIFVGNRSAIQGRQLTWRTFALSGLLSVVMIVILDLDRPREGLITINSDAIRATISELELSGV
jgi:hypothetical protein